ncbi:hypothetical protein CK503_14670 [Aliifodinibius salipaludis]|uniref:DUF5673 domain-containing protein n=1 Tax=Fodinibius salipaludis TaxID=2032627 RepID=A0A2A2G573_9BACT|nr:hypothetical protein [Aliifodinibius salipaludis]PAU92926.1 hypothetical protein CK503_14670 [Aliifodinibius salipaludis]
MYLIITFLVLAFLLSFWTGYRRILRLQHLNQRRVVNGFVGAMILLTVISAGQWLDLISWDIAAHFTMFLYCIVSGFFFGFAIKMIALKRSAREVKYVYRSFWTDAAPNILAILIIVFGIYRTGILHFGPYTGIGITSGLSLLGFGLWGSTIKIVPEFRDKAILILDQSVSWKKVVAYRWQTENVLLIEYYTTDKKLTDFTTYIPPEEELRIERLLAKKLKEYHQDRKEMMSKQGNNP